MLLLGWLLVLPLTAAVDPEHAKNLTVYHVNPHAAGAIPLNMDTGNAAGDVFFDLFEVMMAPLACQHQSHEGHGCTNPEATGKDLVVNKLVLEVDDRFSDYAKCNIGVNGTDQRGHKCKTGTYCCFCDDPKHYGRTVPCQKTLGKENLVDHFGGGSHHWGKCRPWEPKYMCYLRAVFSKLNTTSVTALWYSSLASGYCGAPGADPDRCTWRVVSVDKIVSRECHARTFGNAVQATRPESACLDACGSQKTNTSSPCWTDCFYQAAVGPDAGTPGGAVKGLPLATLTDAWVKPFLPEAQGGCPALPEMRPWFEAAEVEEEE